MKLALSLGLAAMATLAAQEFTRGLGVYPGDPKEYTGPSLELDRNTYRNLALHRPAYQSSSYDYNLTAQLVTDGIKHTRLPRWVSVETSQQGVLPKNQREWVLDGNWVSDVSLKGHHGWIVIEIGGDDRAQVDRVEVDARLQARGEPENWVCTVAGSDDGSAWKDLGHAAGMARPTGELRTSIALAGISRSRYYRISLDNARATNWQVGEIAFFHGGQRQAVGGPAHFTSAWMAAGKGEEWVYVDLGAVCTFDRIALAWIRRPAEGSIQVSDDAAAWKLVQPLSGTDEVKLTHPAQGRYVRVLMTKPATPDGYVLSELEVYGRGGPVAKNTGWKLQRDSLVNADGLALSKPGFRDDDWMIATVPGTTLTTYHNAGAIPDPNFGDNQLAISDSFFYADFWYRHEFVPPPAAPGQHTWLNLDGINWKAEVFLNGAKLGRMDGGFIRGRFDVSRFLHPGMKNFLAVRVEKNATPGSVKEKTFENPDKNGGALGADNPTYHASIGWDWIPTIRGRNTGIWGKVYLSVSGPVTIEAPLLTSTLPLPNISSADVAITATLHNAEARAVSGVLRGRFGDNTFETAVSLDAGAEKSVSAALHIQNAKLWWPAGYGDPNLYPVELRFQTAPAKISDRKQFSAGIRQFTYSEEGGAFKMWINGRRFIPRGGNWGFSESMLRYRAREYDAAVRYHREMNFNMIRDWVGQIGDDEFYDACDRYGIVVWQDFWLANPWDGPDPGDDAMFLRVARDYIRRIRSHPSIGLYCGRNEGYPPKPLDDGIRAALAELHPGIHYISSSADDGVSGHGPYQAMPTKTYFSRAPSKFHSEMGMPDIVSMDSLALMMPQSAMWPQGRMWGLHDFCISGAQGGGSFVERLRTSYGEAKDAAEWLELAQFVNYEGYRAMFEAQSRNRMGLLIWMSHPAWPSLVWQTYDYFLEPTAAYFGAKKASEPLHIQWNPVDESVEVVNYSGGDARGLWAHVAVLNLDGSVQWEQSASVDSLEDSTASPIKMQYPSGVSAVHFLRMELMRGADVLSQNFYWRGVQDGDYRALRELPLATVQASQMTERRGDRWHLTTELYNSSNTPALMVKIKAVRDKTGDRILPAIYSDNYIALMPGERRTLATDVQYADARGEQPRIVVSGFNARDVAPRKAAPKVAPMDTHGPAQ
ncbi:MAG TPA: discoidin domain-containing protein [Bryobacteraceae bacterium]|nr:discoidin domain-containing protein [Bryobacteraceae bacterium]